MVKLEEKIMKTLRQYQLINQGDKIVLGVSGGPDSMCMLQALKNTKQEKTIKFEIVVAHVNHQLRKEADDEERYVRKYCEKNGIEFYSQSINIKELANQNKMGIEEAGRKARYEFFDEILKKTKANKIAVAHNKNDKIETILWHTLRGSGMEGLIGIEAKRGNIIRPLIECERVEIEQYCEQNKLEPKIDNSNFDNCYTRNKIRNVVVPYIQKEFNPNIMGTLGRLSEIIKQENDYMKEQTKKVYQEIQIKENKEEIIIDWKKFVLQEKVIKARLIRFIIGKLFGTMAGIEKIHIEDIIKLCDNNIGNKYLTPNKNLKIFVNKGKVYFTKKNK